MNKVKKGKLRWTWLKSSNDENVIISKRDQKTNVWLLWLVSTLPTLLNESRLIKWVRLGEENKNRYVIATQSLELRKELRKVAGTPIIYIARSVVLLETPSDQTLAKKSAVRFPCPFETLSLGLISKRGPSHRWKTRNYMHQQLNSPSYRVNHSLLHPTKKILLRPSQ